MSFVKIWSQFYSSLRKDFASGRSYSLKGLFYDFILLFLKG